MATKAADKKTDADEKKSDAKKDNAQGETAPGEQPLGGLKIEGQGVKGKGETRLFQTAPDTKSWLTEEEAKAKGFYWKPGKGEA